MIPFCSSCGLVPSTSGIYSIVNTNNLKRYVGSAVNLRARFAKHRCCLRSKSHPNPHLSLAYQEYGEESFKFCILELCPVIDILVREQGWMDYFRSHRRESGYNFLPIAGTRLGSRLSKDQKLAMSIKLKSVHEKNPDIGRRSGQNRIGRKNSPEHIAKVVSKCSKPFSFKSPDGIIYTGRNYAEFCRNHGLNKSAMHQLMDGVEGHRSHHGWTVVKT